MFVPAICSVYYGENDLWPIIQAALITIGIGLPCRWFFRGEQELNMKDGIFHIDGGLEYTMFLTKRGAVFAVGNRNCVGIPCKDEFGIELVHILYC